MAQEDGLNILRQPAIDLPEDIGDGPFWTTSPDPNAPRPRFADTETFFKREEPFEDNIMTDNPVMGPSERIALGVFHVSDTLRPNSFRRVHQTFTHRPSEDLPANVTFQIEFTGAGQAIVRQGLHATAELPAGALSAALGALDDGALLPAPTMYAQSTSFEIRLRMPGYEPTRQGVQTPDWRCFDTNSDFGRQLLSANSIETFTFGNSGRERKIFPINYPVGRSIPVIFDVVNHMPTHRAIVDIIVKVLAVRRT